MELKLSSNEKIYNVSVARTSAPDLFEVRVNGRKYVVRLLGEVEGRRLSLIVDNTVRNFDIISESYDSIKVGVEGSVIVFGRHSGTETIRPASTRLVRSETIDLKKDIPSPVPARVTQVRVKVGDKVKRGDVLVVLESMKMQTSISSPRDGAITDVTVKPGLSVSRGSKLVSIS